MLQNSTVGLILVKAIVPRTSLFGVKIAFYAFSQRTYLTVKEKILIGGFLFLNDNIPCPKRPVNVFGKFLCLKNHSYEL